MHNSWSVRDAETSMQDLDDEVEYHRFLERFKVEEQERRLKDILYGCKRFRTLAGEDEKS